MNPTPQHVVVVGAGIIGSATAYALARAGCRVTLLDRGRLGGGCSHANCGYVSPSHVLPLCVPGAVKKTMGMALKPNSPFRIAPRLDPRLWGWLLRFAANCDDRKAVPAGFARKALIERSTELYKRFLAEENLDCEWEDRGCIFAQESPAAYEAYGRYVKTLEDTFGQSGWVGLKGEALVAHEPAIKPGTLAGGWLFKGDAHMRPDRLMEAYRTALLRRGVTLLEERPVLGFRIEGGRCAAVRTAQGEIGADAVVVAAGAWTPMLERDLGFKVPIQPGKGYSITMDRPANCPATPLIFQDVKVAVTPFKSGYRIGSLMEFAGYDDKLEERRLQLLRAGAARYLHTPMGGRVEEQWWGWRPMTATGLPVIGPAPSAPNLFVAAGHNMEGMCMGAGTGELVMQLVTGQRPQQDAAPFAWNRA